MPGKKKRDILRLRKKREANAKRQRSSATIKFPGAENLKQAKHTSTAFDLMSLLEFRRKRAVLHTRTELPRLSHLLVSLKQELAGKEKRLRKLAIQGLRSVQAEIDVLEIKQAILQVQISILTARDKIDSPEQLQKIKGWFGIEEQIREKIRKKKK